MDRHALHALGIPHPYPAGAGAAWIGTHSTLLAAHVANVFAIIERQSGALVGAVGLEIAADGREAEVGYWIGVPYWNRGYATEAAAAVLNHGFGEGLALDRVTARHFVRNPASGRVLDKLGMRSVETVTVEKDGRVEHAMRLAISAAEWIERHHFP